MKKVVRWEVSSSEGELEQSERDAELAKSLQQRLLVL